MPNLLNDDDDGRVAIRVQGPLPANVASTLMSLIGAAWPDSMVQTNSQFIALDIRIPNEPAKSVDQEFVDEIVRSAGADDGSVFNGFRDGWVAFAPPEELCLYLGEVCHSLLEASEGAVNHLEWEVRTGNKADDPSYVLSASRSKGQTPQALWKASKKRVEQLEALLEANGIEVPT